MSLSTAATAHIPYALLELVEAAEAAGWDLSENKGVLDRARQTLATAVVVSAEDAALINCFLPRNPNKVRNFTPENKPKMVKAVSGFQRALYAAALNEGRAR